MIYIKRFCFVIVCIIAIVCMGIGVLLQLLTFPIFGAIYYVFTGKDPLSDSYMDFSVVYMGKFIDWYKEKFGPE